jgi:hypothetical protein
VDAETKMIAVFWQRGCWRIIAASSKPSSLGHADVDQDDGDVGLEEVLERLAPELALIRFSPSSPRMAS